MSTTNTTNEFGNTMKNTPHYATRIELGQAYLTKLRNVMAMRISDSEPTDVSSELKVGRFLKDALNHGTDTYMTFLPTSPTKGDWYMWNGIIHTEVDWDADDLMVSAFLDMIEEITEIHNQAYDEYRVVFEHSKTYESYENGIEQDVAKFVRKKKNNATDTEVEYERERLIRVILERLVDSPSAIHADDSELRLKRSMYSRIFKARPKTASSLMGSWIYSKGIGSLKQRVRAEFLVAKDHFAANRKYIVSSNGYCYEVDASAKTIHGPFAPDCTRPVIRHLAAELPTVSKVGPGAGWNELMAEADRVEHPMWTAWLDEFVPNPDDQAYLQEACGAALLGMGRARNIVHLVGAPATGKSTFINTIDRVMGTVENDGYSGLLPKEAITAKHGGSSNFLQKEAKDVRFLHLSEPDTSRVDGSFLKNLSGGGEAIITDVKNHDAVSWYPECVLFIAANSVINIATWDKAIVQRLNIVEFKTEVKKIDSAFEYRLFDAEATAILGWILEGAERYLAQGSIHVPQCIRDRGEANAVESSGPIRFITEQTDWKVFPANYTEEDRVTLRNCVLVTDAYSKYVDWSIMSGEKTVSRKHFTNDIHRYTGLADGVSNTSNGVRLYGVSAVERKYVSPDEDVLESGFNFKF